MYRKISVALLLSGSFLMAGCGSNAGPITGGVNPTITTAVAPSTAIKHVVVIFGENISFDHYFGTYPNAANTGGTTFTAAAGTPIPNNYISNPTLLTANPNLTSANGSSATNPFRLGPNQAGTGDQGHNYNPEQLAFDNGKMDLFPVSVGTADAAALVNETAARHHRAQPRLLRRQHRHRAVELRAALCDERPQLRQRLRSFHARRS
jgi:phospholipase C